MKGHHIGELEELIVLAIQFNGGRSYAPEILATLSGRAKREVDVGPMYNTLKRMVASGLLTFDDYVPEKRTFSDRPLRYYTITEHGSRAAILAEMARENLRLAPGGTPLT
jgi:DNA-binding PadR family transcriptional regulator